jgi:hypothetical protein
MRPIIVGLWSRDTTKHSTSTTTDKIRHLKDALTRLAAMMQAQKIPDKQDIRGILIAPEYFFTKPNAGKWNGISFNDRSLSQTDVQNAVNEFEVVSKANQKVLLVPGTFAWKKPLIRPVSEARKFSSLTGDRSGPLKSTSRLDQARQNLTHEQATTGERMGGARLGSDPLGNVIFTFLTDPANAPFFVANQVYFNSRGVAITDKVGLYHLFLRTDDLLNIIAPEAMWRPHVTAVPSLAQKTVALGTATSMMRNTAFVLLNGRVRFKYNKQGDFHEAIGDGAQTVFVPGAKAGVCAIGAIRFGFEICLDHCIGYLSRVQNTHPLPSGQAREARDIHIVTSAAVENKTTNMYVRPGGYFLHASTNKGWTCVYHNKPASGGTPGGLVAVSPLTGGESQIDGDPFRLFRIELPTFGMSGV